MRETIVIQHTERLSADETRSQRATFEAEGWSAVLVKQRPDLAGSGWKAYEWSGVKENRISLVMISVPSLDVNADELHAALAKDYELENFEVTDWTAPIVVEDGYLIHSVTIRSTTPVCDYCGTVEHRATAHTANARDLERFERVHQ